MNHVLKGKGDSPILLFRRIKVFFFPHPEWWIWMLSVAAWMFYFAGVKSHETRHYTDAISCVPFGYANPPASSGFFHSVSLNSILSWIVMVIAMMFPLLRTPAKHVAFSVQWQNRHVAMLFFLTGYLITWTAFGFLFNIAIVAFNTLTGNYLFVSNGYVQGILFLIAAILIWHPGRPTNMIKCSQTAAIRIHGIQLILDTLVFGIRTGYNCLMTCWVCMIAVLFNHSNAWLMFVVSVILYFERYFVPHYSKTISYIWVMLSIEILILQIT